MISFFPNRIIICHFITFFRSMKQNLVVLLGDLFNLCELHPAKCVIYPGMDQLQGES